MHKTVDKVFTTMYLTCSDGCCVISFCGGKGEKDAIFRFRVD